MNSKFLVQQTENNDHHKFLKIYHLKSNYIKPFNIMLGKAASKIGNKSSLLLLVSFFMIASLEASVRIESALNRKVKSIQNDNDLAKEPEVPATKFRAKPSYSVARLEWKNGDGSRRVVVLKEADNPMEFIPEDGQEYQSNSVFQIGQNNDRNFTVFNGKPNFVRVTGLKPLTTYKATIFECRGAGDRINYLTSSYDSVTFTTKENGQPVIDLISPECINPGSSIVLKGRNIGKTNKVTLNGDSLAFAFQNENTLLVAIPDSAQNGKIMLETNVGIDSSFNRLEIIPQEPIFPSSELVVNVLSTDSVEINWTPGDGDRQLVVLSKSDNIFAFIPQDCDFYPTATAFGSGQDKNGHFVIFGGAKSQVIVTDLTENTSYDVFIYDYNKTDGRVQNYLVTEILQGSFNTADSNTSKEADQLVNNSTDFLAYPNPTNNLVNLKISKQDIKTPVVINVFDMSGVKVYEQRFEAYDTDMQINFEQFNQTGLYFVKVFFNDQTYSKMIIVK